MISDQFSRTKGNTRAFALSREAEAEKPIYLMSTMHVSLGINEKRG